MSTRSANKAKLDIVTVFPDTNIFLHFQIFDQIPWKKELKAATVCIRVASVVARELIKHRDGHPVTHIRERAKKTLRKLREYAIAEGGRVSDGVYLYCETESQTCDFIALGLNPDSQDDQILGEILLAKHQRPDDRIVLLTDDDPFAIRAHTKGVEVLHLSDSLRLAPQPDARAKTIRDLKQQVLDLTAKEPKLSLAFSDGGASYEFRLEPEVVITELDVQKYVNSQRVLLNSGASVERWRTATANAEQLDRSRYPEQAVQLFDLMTNFSEFMATKASLDWERFFVELALYYKAWWAYTNEARRTKILQLWLRNTGKARAEDVNVFLRVPKRVDVFPNGKPQQPPTPPLRPGEKRAKPTPATAAASPSSRISFVGAVDLPDAWEFHYHLPELNQHLSEVLGLTLRFPPLPFAQPLLVHFRMAAVNMSDAVEGDLSVVPASPGEPPKLIPERQKRPR